MYKCYDELETVILRESDFGILNTVVESSKSWNSFQKNSFLEKIIIFEVWTQFLSVTLFQ